MLNTEGQTYYAKLKQFETELINEALRRARGNQAQAARMPISSRARWTFFFSRLSHWNRCTLGRSASA